MGSTLLIPLGLGSIIRVDNLPRLPSMDHGEVLIGLVSILYMSINNSILQENN